MSARGCVGLSLVVFLLAIASANSAFGQSSSSPGALEAVVETSTGRSFHQKVPTGWSAVYAGRKLRVDQRFVAASDATMRLAVGDLRVDVLPITIGAISRVDGNARDPHLRLRLEAGAVRVIQPRGSSALTTIDCIFGSVSAVDSEFLIDGNRLSVIRGKASVSNRSGNRRTLFAGEELIIPSTGFLPIPTRTLK